MKLLDDFFSARRPHYEQDFRCPFQGSAKNDCPFGFKIVHKAGVGCPLLLAFQRGRGLPGGATSADHSKYLQFLFHTQLKLYSQGTVLAPVASSPRVKFAVSSPLRLIVGDSELIAYFLT